MPRHAMEVAKPVFVSRAERERLAIAEQRRSALLDVVFRAVTFISSDKDRRDSKRGRDPNGGTDGGKRSP